MTNTELREKLVEMLMQADIADNISDDTTRHREFSADFLIANGVTFATDKNDGGKWISVNDRLPEENGEYLISFLYTGVKMNELVAKSVWINSECLTPEERGKFPLGCFHAQSMSNVKVTNWMPLPELPKEEYL